MELKEIDKVILLLTLPCEEMEKTDLIRLKSKEYRLLTKELIKNKLNPVDLYDKKTAEDISKKLGILPKDRITRLLNERNIGLAFQLEKIKSIGIDVITRASSMYPDRIKNKLGLRAPPFLYVCGNLEINKTETIGIVGSRKIDDVTSSFTKKLGKKAALFKKTVVSGGARGVDSISMESSLESNGKVIVYLPAKMSEFIKKKKWREGIINNKILVLSSYNPFNNFSVSSAMDRNKHIYAESDRIIIVSSALGEGGTWAGAIENIKNNWAPMFVRGDDHIPEGNKKLIELGGGICSDKDLDSPGWWDYQYNGNTGIKNRQLELF